MKFISNILNIPSLIILLVQYAALRAKINRWLYYISKKVDSGIRFPNYFKNMHEIYALYRGMKSEFNDLKIGLSYDDIALFHCIILKYTWLFNDFINHEDFSVKNKRKMSYEGSSYEGDSYYYFDVD